MTLHEFFTENPKLALAYSGGTDSAYLLWAALHEKAEVCAYCVRSPFQPRFELEDAKRLAKQLHAKLKFIPLDVLCDTQIASNPPDRCYHCKRAVFSAILKEAKKDGYSVLADGTNLSDDLTARPGAKALSEFGVRSPLRECGLTKEDIRRLSREAGLFTWNKPAYACLATRIPAHTPITGELLARTEAAEDFLMQLGFSDFRIRLCGLSAKIQVCEAQMPLLLKNREAVLAKLKQYYDSVLLDLEVRDA